MKKFKQKYIDKFAHVGAGNIFAFVLIAILTLLNIHIWIVNITTFLSGIALAFAIEFYDQKKGGKADEFDAIATVVGVMVMLIMFNFF